MGDEGALFFVSYIKVLFFLVRCSMRFYEEENIIISFIHGKASCGGFFFREVEGNTIPCSSWRLPGGLPVSHFEWNLNLMELLLMHVHRLKHANFNTLIFVLLFIIFKELKGLPFVNFYKTNTPFSLEILLREIKKYIFFCFE